MRSHAPGFGDGFIHELVPLMKNGCVILRSILDILIDRIEDAEQSRQTDVRKDIYASIIDALETEIENIQTEGADAPTAEAKVEALEAIISVLLREMEEIDVKRQKRGKRPKKVKID